jgi:hypothetical protein
MPSIPKDPIHRHPKTVLDAEQASVRNLIPRLLDAGFRIECDMRDDSVVIRDLGNGIAVFLQDSGILRMKMQAWFSTSREAGGDLGHLRRTRVAARQLNARLWGKVSCDEDGDIVLSHTYQRGTATLLCNLMCAIRDFSSQAQCLSQHLISMGLLRDLSHESPRADRLLDGETGSDSDD